MSTPSEHRRLTRGSLRRQVTGDGQNDLNCGGEYPTVDRVVRIRDGLSSASEPDTCGESDQETRAVRPQSLNVERQTVAGGQSGADRSVSPQRRTAERDERASEKLAWRLAAREVGVPFGEPLTSADETSQDEAERCPETEYESALSAEEDRATVVDVETRGAPVYGNPVMLISDQQTDDEVDRAVGAYHALREAAQTCNRSARARIVELPCEVPLRTSASRDTRSPPRLSPRPSARCDVEQLTDAQEQAEAVRLEQERDAARREHSQRRRKSRHTQVQTAAAPDPVEHQRQRHAAAGDQHVRKAKQLLRRESPLLPPLGAVDDDDVGGVASPRERYFSREGGLRMPLFDGGDWAGFMSQFEACVNYYGWTEKTKAIRLYTSIIGEARKTLGAVGASNWSFAQLKRHMEVRYGKSKVFAQIQAELLQRMRKPEQSLHTYHDELVAASHTANIPEHQRADLVHTAFVYGLRNNQHMHRWVTRHEREPTLEAALQAAEEYEEEYGSDPVFQSLPVSVNARDSTGNALAVALIGSESKSSPQPTVSVNAVQTEDEADLRKAMDKGFKQLTSSMQSRFDKLDTRVASVEKWQADQIQYFKDRAAKQRAEREKRNKDWKQKRNNNNGNQRQSSGDNQSSAPVTQEVNARQTRSNVPVDAE